MKIGITIGDPSGVGPEIIQRAFARFEGIEPVVYGHPDLLPELDPALVKNIAGAFNVDAVKPGEACLESAWIQRWALDAAIADVQTGAIDAIVTAPWTKSLFQMIDLPQTGHTEVLADAFNAPHHVMMLAGPRLRVALVTAHTPISRVPELITRKRVEQTIEVVAGALERDFGIVAPRIAVLGLNPHAGEAGAIGREEIDVIVPAIENCMSRGHQIDGPFSADSYFRRYLDPSTENDHDAVVAMYHDQGLIPLKTIHGGEAANITLGLPIVRTSVDHGTAYDIAGTGTADPASLIYAVETAVRLATQRRG